MVHSGGEMHKTPAFHASKSYTAEIVIMQNVYNCAP